MSGVLSVLVFAAGLAALIAGVAWRWGTPWGLIVGGALTAALTVLYARGADA